MQPQASESVQDAPEVQIVHNTKSEPKDVTERQETAKDEQKETPKPQTWQDNPQKCNQDTQFIAAEPPFDCIDKPVHTANVAQPVAASASTSGGDCNSWKAAAGIPNTHATNTLINNESGCNPSVYNQAGSGACGIPQALPCSKLTVDAGCTLDAAGAVWQLRWMDNYVKNRYNTWEGALAFWHCKGTCYNNYGATHKTTNWY